MGLGGKTKPTITVALKTFLVLFSMNSNGSETFQALCGQTTCKNWACKMHYHNQRHRTQKAQTKK